MWCAADQVVTVSLTGHVQGRPASFFEMRPLVCARCLLSLPENLQHIESETFFFPVSFGGTINTKESH